MTHSRLPHELYLFTPGEAVYADVTPGWVRVTLLTHVRDHRGSAFYRIERDSGLHGLSFVVNEKGREVTLRRQVIKRRIGEYTVGYRFGFQRLLAADRKAQKTRKPPPSRLGVEFEPLPPAPPSARNGSVKRITD